MHNKIKFRGLCLINNVSMPPVPPLLLSLLHEHLSCYPSMRVAMWFQPIAISFIVESIEPPAKLTRAADSGFYSLNYYFYCY